MSLVDLAQLGPCTQRAVQHRKIVYTCVRHGLRDALRCLGTRSFIVGLGLRPAIDVRADELQEPDRLGGVGGRGFEREWTSVSAEADARGCSLF